MKQKTGVKQPFIHTLSYLSLIGPLIYFTHRTAVMPAKAGIHLALTPP
jgi:hypothetical protein